MGLERPLDRRKRPFFTASGKKIPLYTREIFFSFLKNEKNIGNSTILSLNHPDVLFLYKFSYLKRLNLYPFVRMTPFVKLSLTTIHPPEELLFFRPNGIRNYEFSYI